MRAVRLLILVLVAAGLTGCATNAAGWTYAPAPPATPIPSGDASAEPSGAPSDGPAVDVTITAFNLAFDPDTTTAPADAPFSLAFVNNDPSIPHDVVIRDAGGTEVFKTEVFPGVETRQYEVPALAAGAYPFVCSVHPTMTGTLTAG